MHQRAESPPIPLPTVCAVPSWAKEPEKTMPKRPLIAETIADTSASAGQGAQPSGDGVVTPFTPRRRTQRGSSATGERAEAPTPQPAATATVSSGSRSAGQGGRRSGTSGLTKRQREVLDVIKKHHALYGYPPSVREIAAAMGLNSPSTVSHHLNQLTAKGLLRREGNKPRALEVQDLTAQQSDTRGSHPRPGDATDPQAANGSSTAAQQTRRQVPPAVDEHLPQATHVPVLGQIAAGQPILAEQNIDAHFPLPAELVGKGELFLLQVVGESMQDAGIFDGDWVAVRSQPVAELGDFVAAMIDGDATVKEFHRTDDGVWLLPHNPLFEPIPAEEATILGKVVAVLRKI